MKKLLFALMLALGLAFTPISIKAEEPTEEPPVAEEQPTEEPKEDAPEETPEEETITIEDVEIKINDLIKKLEDAGYLDDTDFGKWFEKNTGVAISVAIAFILGLLSTALLVIKAIKEAKEVFNNSDKLSNKVDKSLTLANETIDKQQALINKLTEENAKMFEEYKAYVEKTNKYIDEVQEKVDKNRANLLSLAESIDGVIQNEKGTDNTREI